MPPTIIPPDRQTATSAEPASVVTELLNKNVKNSLFYYFTISLSESSWGYAALSAYLKDVGGDNAHVGLAEGMQGLAQLIFAIASGRFADSIGRQRPIRIGGLVGFVALLAMWSALYFVHENSQVEFWTCTVGLFFWGAFRGVTLAPLEALFADSVSIEERSKMLTIRYIFTILGAALGPLVAAILFKAFGDDWSLVTLRRVIMIGSSFSLVSLACLFRFKDKHSLAELMQGDGISDSPQAKTIRIRCFLADVFGSLASGMTIRFFPLFFKEETGLSPASVNAVMITTTLSMAVVSYGAQMLSKRFGRVYVICASKVVGITLLFCMAYWKDIWTMKALVVPIYVVRTVLMNCTAPLHKSILMDHTPRNSRGIWNAADSVTAFGWSGSALVGGLIADRYGYGATFGVTASMQAIGLFVLLTMIPLVKDVCEVRTAIPTTPSATTEPLLGDGDGSDRDVDSMVDLSPSSSPVM